MPISRGQFLRALGKSLPGYALGTATALGSKLLASAQNAQAPIPPLMMEKKSEIKFFRSAQVSRRQIALTFDDGPTPGSTEKILDELKSRGGRATFFMIGREIAAHPEIARRVMAEGHEIGNHTFTHPKLTTLSDAAVEEEIHDTQRQFADHLEYHPGWFRPPYGELRQDHAALVARFGLRVAMWSVDTKDWSTPPHAEIIQAVTNETKPGSVILCHDNQANTADVLPAILDVLLQHDFELVTLTNLFA